MLGPQRGETGIACRARLCGARAAFVAIAVLAGWCRDGRAQIITTLAGCQTTLCVAFESFGVGIPRPNHTALVVNNGRGITAFEANPSGTSSGYLIVRIRPRPFPADTVFKSVANANAPASFYVSRITELGDEINASHVPYAPAPEIWWTAANSNSFVYSVLVHLGLQPPSSPFGIIPGYFNNLTDWQH